MKLAQGPAPASHPKPQVALRDILQRTWYTQAFVLEIQLTVRVAVDFLYDANLLLYWHGTG